MMKKLISKVALFTFIIFMSSSIFATSQFCTGFEEGYKAIKGDIVVVPVCPAEPVTPAGSTSFREGIKKGMERAKR